MIIGYGMPRTGGQSLVAALVLMGVRVHKWDLDKQFLIEEIDDQNCDAVVEVREPIEAVLARWPAAKIIYTHRNTEYWHASLDRTREQNELHPNPIWRASIVERERTRAIREADLPAETLWLNICEDTGKENWRKLTEFLDLPKPVGPFPHHDMHIHSHAIRR